MSCGSIVCVLSDNKKLDSFLSLVSFFPGFSSFWLVLLLHLFLSSSLIFPVLTASPSSPSSMPHSVILLWQGMICQQIRAIHYACVKLRDHLWNDISYQVTSRILKHQFIMCVLCPRLRRTCFCLFCWFVVGLSAGLQENYFIWFTWNLV